MKYLLQLSMAAFTTFMLTSTMLSPAGAESWRKPVGFEFEQQEVDPSKFIALAQLLS
jgi:hypothetical protein